MRWITFCLPLLLSGCAKSNPELAQAKEIVQLYAQFSTDLAAVQTPEDIPAAVKKFEAARSEVGGNIAKKKLDPEKVQEALQNKELQQQLGASRLEHEATLNKLHAKFQKDDANPKVLIETSMGSIKVELFEKLAPVTVKNFLGYVDAKHYDGVIFHRVMPDFMIQGGGFNADMSERPIKSTIRNESDNLLSNLRGNLAMARTPVPDSASAQFFINTVDNPNLDRLNSADTVGYAVFGRVIEGMEEVVDKIKDVKTATVGQHQNVPVEAVIIKSVKRI